MRKLKETEKKLIAANQEWKCLSCKSILKSTYQIDHIIPFSISQDDSINNLQALCANCHSLKTQKESNRIVLFKKLRATVNSNLCWFCLEKIDSFENQHSCTRYLKEIKPQKKNNPYEQTNFDLEISKLYHISKSESSTTTSTSSTSTTTSLLPIPPMNENELQTLKIKLGRWYIWVNNYFTDSNDLTLDDIKKAIHVATKSKSLYKIYKSVEVTITIGRDFDEETPDDLIEFLYEHLPSILPSRILHNEEIDISFICY